MKVNQGDRMPPPLAPSVENLLVHERVLPVQPSELRSRAMLRAQQALTSDPLHELGLKPISARSTPSRVRQLAVAAGVTVALAAAAAIHSSRQRAAALVAAPSLRHETLALVASINRTTADALTEWRAITATSSVATGVPTHAVLQSRNRDPAEKLEGGLSELSLLTRARAADKSGNYASVLAIATEHERSFPAGRLVEEREVLQIKAMVALGRVNESRQLAAKFRRQFPRSVLLQRVDAMLASRP